MLGYTKIILYLIRALKKKFSNIKSVQYTSNILVVGKLKSLLEFFRQLCELGPIYEYFPKETKSILIKNKRYLVATK